MMSAQSSFNLANVEDLFNQADELALEDGKPLDSTVISKICDESFDREAMIQREEHEQRKKAEAAFEKLRQSHQEVIDHRKEKGI